MPSISTPQASSGGRPGELREASTASNQARFSGDRRGNLQVRIDMRLPPLGAAIELLLAEVGERHLGATDRAAQQRAHLAQGLALAGSSRRRRGAGSGEGAGRGRWERRKDRRDGRRSEGVAAGRRRSYPRLLRHPNRRDQGHLEASRIGRWTAPGQAQHRRADKCEMQQYRDGEPGTGPRSFRRQIRHRAPSTDKGRTVFARWAGIVTSAPRFAAALKLSTPVALSDRLYLEMAATVG